MKQLRMSWKSPQGTAGLETFLGKIKERGMGMCTAIS